MKRPLVIKAGTLPFMGLQRVRHDGVTGQQQFTDLYCVPGTILDSENSVKRVRNGSCSHRGDSQMEGGKYSPSNQQTEWDGVMVTDEVSWPHRLDAQEGFQDMALK